ncbi:MAG: HAMP domain-containing sensor histidine kinase [Clostridia bacterium]|nr:HAMP domain-containing sensor histidine kinase [Clostridia bacterium]
MMIIQNRPSLRAISLHVKLLALALLVTVPLLITSIWGAVSSARIFAKIEVQANRRCAEDLSDGFTGYLSRLWDAQERICAPVCRPEASSQCSRAYPNCLDKFESYPAVAACAILTPDGSPLASTSAWKQPADVRGEEWMSSIASGADSVVSGIVTDQEDPDADPLIYVATALRSGKSVNAITVAQVNVRIVGKILSQRQSSASGFALVDPTGRVVHWRLSRDDPQTFVLAVFDHGCDSADLLGGGDYVAASHASPRATGSIGHVAMVAMVAIRSVGWTAIAMNRPNVAAVTARLSARRWLLGTVACMILGATAAWDIGHSIVSRVGALEQAANALTAGDFSARVGLRGEDEFASAGRAFDRMAKTLSDHEIICDRLVRVCAHELRNPLASMKGAVSLMRLQTASNPSGHELEVLIQVVERASDRISDLLTQVIQTSTVSHSQRLTKRSLIDMRDVVNSSLRSRGASCASGRLVVSGADSASLAAPVLGNREQLAIVIENLVGNAEKYSMGRGRIRVMLTVHPAEESAEPSRDGGKSSKSANHRRHHRTQGGGGVGAVHLTVSDDGVGIPERDLDTLFDVFKRGSNLENCDPGGMGLGLYVARIIVSQHEGRISVRSNEGQGSSFHVELPIASTPDGRNPDGQGPSSR